MPTHVNSSKVEALEASFGDRLRDERKALGLTQEAMAQHLNVVIRSVKGYEAGSTTVASDVIYRMMAIGIDICRLFYGVPFEAQSGLQPQIDATALDRAIAWVDGEWGNDGDGRIISDRERIEWILIAYKSITGGTLDEAEGMPHAMPSKQRKSG